MLCWTHGTHPRREPAGAQHWRSSWCQKKIPVVLREKEKKCDDQRVFLPLVPVLNIPSFRFLVSMCFYELIPRVLRPLGETSWCVSVWGAERESDRTETPRYLWPSLHHASRARSLLPGRRPCDSTYTLQLYKVWSLDILVHYNH